MFHNDKSDTALCVFLAKNTPIYKKCDKSNTNEVRKLKFFMGTPGTYPDPLVGSIGSFFKNLIFGVTSVTIYIPYGVTSVTIYTACPATIKKLWGANLGVIPWTYWDPR